MLTAQTTLVRRMRCRCNGIHRYLSDRWIYPIPFWYTNLVQWKNYFPRFFQSEYSSDSWNAKCIASFETLAQIAILYIVSRSSPGFRFPLKIPSLTDNSGTEAGGNKLFSTTVPLNHFLERLTLLCTISGMELDLSHIAGHRNDEADALSRWDFVSEPPFNRSVHNRFPLSLQQLWHPETSVSLHLAETFLSWQLP